MTRTSRRAGVLLAAVLAALAGCTNANLVGGRNYVSQGVYDKAVAVLEKAVVELPSDPEPHFLLGKAYAETGQHDKAPEELARAAELDPGYYALRADTVRSGYHAKLFNSGNELLQAGQYTEALDRYRKAAAYRPTDVSVHQNLGFVYLKLGRRDEALAEYMKMYEINPKDLGPLKTALGVLSEAGERGQAIELARKIHEANPQDLQAAGALADMYMEDATAARDAGDTEAEKAALRQAVPLFETIAESDPTRPAPLYQLGIAFFSLEEFQKAGESFEKAVELSDPKDPLHVDALSNLVAAMYKLKQFAKAEMHLRDLIALEPAECGHYRLLSGALREQGRTNEALEAAKKYEECKD